MKIIIAGASGRMGRELIKKALSSDKFTIVGATENPESEYINQDIGELVGIKNTGIKISSDILYLVKEADGIIDFTNPETSIENSIIAAQTRIVHVIGTTGFTNDQHEKHLDCRFRSRPATARSAHARTDAPHRAFQRVETLRASRGRFLCD